jgi:hypothetical protein
MLMRNGKKLSKLFTKSFGDFVAFTYVHYSIINYSKIVFCDNDTLKKLIKVYTIDEFNNDNFYISLVYDVANSIINTRSCRMKLVKIDLSLNDNYENNNKLYDYILSSELTYQYSIVDYLVGIEKLSSLDNNQWINLIENSIIMDKYKLYVIDKVLK